MADLGTDIRKLLDLVDFQKLEIPLLWQTAETNREAALQAALRAMYAAVRATVEARPWLRDVDCAAMLECFILLAVNAALSKEEEPTEPKPPARDPAPVLPFKGDSPNRR